MLTERISGVAKPTLKTCFEYTKSSCCTSLHDQDIGTVLKDTLSDPCAESFREMTQYFCFGCFSDQPLYTDATAKTIKICQDFAERLYGASLDQVSTIYDSCGLRVNEQIINPSRTFKDGYTFFASIKPPFFNDYRIIIAGDNNDCYNTSTNLINSSVLLMISTWLVLLLSQ